MPVTLGVGGILGFFAAFSISLYWGTSDVCIVVLLMGCSLINIY